MNEKIEDIIKLVKSKKGKRWLFFGFYFIFFIFLFFYIDGQDLQNKNLNNENNNNDNNQNIKTSYYETEKLENSDYKYKITIQKNNELEIIEGNKNNNENIKNYEYYQFIDLLELKRIIKNAKYLSKSLYSDNTYKVNYEIKTSELDEIIDSKLNDENNTLNNIILTVLENNDLIGIELDFSNYMKLINNIDTYKVLINYEY